MNECVVYFRSQNYEKKPRGEPFIGLPPGDCLLNGVADASPRGQSTTFSPSEQTSLMDALSVDGYFCDCGVRVDDVDTGGKVQLCFRAVA